MAQTYEPIATYTAGAGGVTSFEFTSIPQTYTDLRIVHSMRLKSGNANVYNAFNYNNNTSSNLGYIRWYQAGGSAMQTGVNSTDFQPAAATLTSTTIPVVTIVDIFGYSDTSIKKTSIYTVNQNTGASGWYITHPCSYGSNTAITSIQITDAFAGGFAQYSTATLYGIKAA